MDVQQVFADQAQLLGGGRAAVDPGAAFALGVHGAAQQEDVIGVKAVGFEQVLQRRVAVELGADLGALGAFADNAGVGPGSCNQLQGIDQDGFARAGFTGEDAEAGAEFQLQFSDDDEIT